MTRPPEPPAGGGDPAAGSRTGRGTVVALAIAGVVVLVVIAVALAVLVGGHGRTPTGTAPATSRSGSATPDGSASGSSTTGTRGVPPATKRPSGLGSDPVSDRLATACYRGEMTSCDLLFLRTFDDPKLAGYHGYADTCAGRRAAGSDQYCSEAFPG